VKQTKFAAHVAAGKPRVAARREVYAESPKYPRATERRAAELAAKPHVAAEIRRLTWLSCPPVDDIRGMREHAVRVLSDLSRSAASEEVRLKSALALYRIAETTRAAAAPSASESDQDRLLASLRKLYTEVRGKTARDQDADPLGPEPAPLVPYADDPIDIRSLSDPPPAAAPEPDAAADTQEPASGTAAPELA
jgi:hypothetical protein